MCEIVESDSKISRRFIEGLQKYNLTYDEVKDWKYCGGQGEEKLTLEEQLVHKKHRSRIEYFRLCFPGRELPIYRDKCICGHDIKDNCFITNGTDILVIGNCCNKRFIPKCKKSCERCGQFHKNKLNNLCNNCREEDRIKEEELNKICAKCSINNSAEYETLCKQCLEFERNRREEFFRNHNNNNIVTTCEKLVKRCKICDTEINKKYTMCYKCNSKSKTAECEKCGVNINTKYKVCFNCR